MAPRSMGYSWSTQSRRKVRGQGPVTTNPTPFQCTSWGPGILNLNLAFQMMKVYCHNERTEILHTSLTWFVMFKYVDIRYAGLHLCF